MRSHRVPRTTVSRVRRRTGILAAWSVFALLAIGLCAAVAINNSLLSLSASHTQQCADAAALAACRELLTDDLIRDSEFVVDASDRTQRCRDRALGLADQYRRQRSQMPVLRANQVGVYQCVQSEESDRLRFLQDTLQPDTVHVWLSSHTDPGSRQGLMAPGLASTADQHVSCAATACLQRRVCGFRAGPRMAIPLLPLAIPYDPETRTPGTWSSLDDAGAPDNYRWDDDEQIVVRGEDGLGELSLVLNTDSTLATPAQLLPVQICPSRHDDSIVTRMETGLDYQDLHQAGIDSLTFPRNDHAVVLEDAELDAVDERLPDLIGQRRMFPLVRLGATVTGVELLDVVAARILTTERINDTQIAVTLQPTVLSTGTAIVCRDDSVPEHRYVRKIALLR